MSAIDEPIGELTKLRQADARRHSAEVFELMKEKAAAVLQLDERAKEITGLLAAIKVLTGENDSLKVELNSMKEQRDRAQKEAKRLLRKIATLQDRVNGVDEKEEAVTTHFDSREHHTERS